MLKYFAMMLKMFYRRETITCDIIPSRHIYFMKLKKHTNQSEQGISIIEMVIVVAIIGILSAITITTLGARKYNAENQALTLIDFMREAQQRALSQKKTMRVVINSSDRVINLINENEPADANNDGINDAPTAANDTIIKSARFADNNMFIGVVPTNMTTSPVELAPVAPIVFANSIHPLSLGDVVATMRFRSNGTVLNTGNDAIGTGATPTGATLYVWTRRDSDTSPTPTEADILRSVTVLGSSGSTKLWKCGVINNQCATWTR